MPKCSYKECGNDSLKSPDLKFVHFPNPLEDQRALKRTRKWLSRCGMKAEPGTEHTVTRYAYLCVDHFNVKPGESLNPRLNRKLIPFPWDGDPFPESGESDEEEEELLVKKNTQDKGQDYAVKVSVYDKSIYCRKST